VGNRLGFNTVKGSCIQSLEPMTAKQQRKTDTALAEQSERFYKRLVEPTPPVPSLKWLMIFRMSRTSLRLILDDSWRDYRYYRDQGWFDSDYYYPTHLGPVKKLAGSVFDSFSAARARSRDS
jgi:hypothetical protein